MNLKQYIPMLGWLPAYNREQLNGDLSAGLTVGVMLIPQGMAYAMLAGLPAIYGLYASTVPLILYAIFGTSRQLAVGPVAMVSLLIATGVGKIAEVGSESFIALAILLALMVGIFQLLLGVLRLGFLVNFLSHPVISGFTSAAALIIGLNQLKHLLGINISRSNYIHHILIDAFSSISDIHAWTLLLGVGGIITIILVKRYSRVIPGPLVAVVVGIIIVYFFRLDLLGVKIVKEVPEGFPPFAWPSVSIEGISALLPTALTIALVGFMESFAVAKAIQSKHKNYKVVANQELIGLGMANIGGSFFGSFPTTGGFSRTAVNDQAGAKTGMAAIFSAILIILTLLFLTPLFYYLPQALLASVIMVAVFGLIDYREVIHLWKTDKKDLLMLVVTFLATLATGIEEGIAIGVALSLAMVIYRSSYPHVAVLGKLPGTQMYRNINRYQEAEQQEGMLIVRFDAQLFFANLQFFRDLIDEELTRRNKTRLVIVNGQAINSLDSSAIHMLRELILELKKQGISMVFSGLKGPVRDIMVKNHLVDELGTNHFFNEVNEAVEYYQGQTKLEENYEFQTDLNVEKV